MARRLDFVLVLFYHEAIESAQGVRCLLESHLPTCQGELPEHGRADAVLRRTWSSPRVWFRRRHARAAQRLSAEACTLRDEKSGVEFDTFDDRNDVEEIAGDDIDPQFTRSANFRLGGDEKELAVALCFAAALAKLVNGVVFDPQEGELQTVEEAIDIARKYVTTPSG